MEVFLVLIKVLAPVYGAELQDARATAADAGLAGNGNIRLVGAGRGYRAAGDRPLGVRGRGGGGKREESRALAVLAADGREPEEGRRPPVVESVLRRHGIWLKFS